jgi:hypothetical protein
MGKENQWGPALPGVHFFMQFPDGTPARQERLKAVDKPGSNQPLGTFSIQLRRAATKMDYSALAVGAKVVLNLGCHTVSPLALADFTIDFDPE